MQYSLKNFEYLTVLKELSDRIKLLILIITTSLIIIYVLNIV